MTALDVTTFGHPLVVAGRPEDVQGAFELGPGPLGRREVVAVGLVDGDEVGELEDAAFDPLELVAGAGELEDEEEVDHVGHGDLGLTDPDGLDENHVEAGGLADDDRLAGLARHAAERAARRRGPDEGVGASRQLLHSGLVAEDRTLRNRG